MFHFKPRCERCGTEDVGLIMSRFNTDTICFPCEEKEKAHPKYAEAARAELQACRDKNFNFPGIGKPEDL